MENLFALFNEVILSNIFLALLLALVAGFISSFSPCVLSSMPLIISYVGGYAKDDKRKAFLYSLSFVSGIIITFTILGIISALLGKVLTMIGSWWYLFLGAIMMVMGLQMLGVIDIIPNKTKDMPVKKGILGAFLLGLFGGVFCIPCSTPALIVILAIVADKGEVLYGILLLLCYAIGHSSILIVAGSSISMAERLVNSSKTSKIGIIIKTALGVLIILMSLYLFYLGF